MHANKLAFQPRPGHKISVEALSIIGGDSRPAIQLAYELNLARNISLTIGVGFGSNRLFDFAGDARVAWTIH